MSVPVNFHVRGIWYNNRFLTVNCCTCDHHTAQHLRHYDHSSGKCLILPPLIIVLTRELPMNLHSVLATQSLTIGECNYFGSHNSDIWNDPGRVQSPHANVWAGLSVHMSASICTFV